MPANRGDESAAPQFDNAVTPYDVALRDCGLRELGGSLDKIADRVVMSLHASEPAYRNGVPSDELQMTKSIDEVLKACRQAPKERADTTGWPREVGRRRAQRGVPLKAMLRAYHIGGQELVGTFQQWAGEEGLPHDRVAALSKDLWSVVDLHCAAATTSFRAEEFELSGGHAAEETGHLLDDLLDGDADRDVVAAVAQAWGLAEKARYAVVICRPADWGVPLEPAELPGMTAGLRIIWRLRGVNAFGIVALRDVSTVEVARTLPVRPGRRTVVSLTVGNLAELGRARRFAELAASTLTGSDRVACLEER